jgi:nucleic acid/nucleotide deaminase of polymorphic system toxin
VPAGDLQSGEPLVTLTGATSGTVVWVQIVPGQADRYHLTVAHDHTYAVGDGQWVVHNSNNCTGGETGSGGSTGARNGAPAVLLPYDGATTEGWLVTNEGDIVPLKSGDSQLPNYASAGHVEGKAALEIRAGESSGGTVWHNNPNGTCNYCNAQIPTLLPEGSTLTVVPPESASAPSRYWFDQPTYYTGNARTPNGM